MPSPSKNPATRNSTAVKSTLRCARPEIKTPANNTTANARSRVTSTQPDVGWLRRADGVAGWRLRIEARERSTQRRSMLR